MTSYIIYKHTSPSGRSYIGLTKDYVQRSNRHRYGGGCRLFYVAIKKYGWDNFAHEILAEGLTLEAANAAEMRLISEHNTLTPSGYNLMSGGNAHIHSDETRQILREKNLGKKLSDETRAKMSASRKGRQHSLVTLEKLRNRTKSPEHIEKVRLANIGKVISEEHRKRISEANKGRIPHNKGKQLSDEHRRKLSEANKGKKKMKLEKVKMGYLAYELDPSGRAKLLELFPPKFPDVVAHHVTLAHGVPCPPQEELDVRVSIKVIGYVEDESLEALVVEVNGKVSRPDGKTFHCTWSLDRSKGRKPVQSNQLIADAGFKSVPLVTVTGVLKFYFM